MILLGQPTIKKFSLLFFLTLTVRLTVFLLYVQHQERYRQADSGDYHNCAALLTHTKSMLHPGTQEPIFWRTPGYPFFLLPFYQWYKVPNFQFSAATHAQKTAIITQIIITSLIPIILFFLALTLTTNLTIAWITAYSAVVHVGFVLASSYLLTDALACFFFFLFMLFLYRSLFLVGEKTTRTDWILNLSLAALSLGAYTWMRPMGKFVAVVVAIMLLFSATKRLKKTALFLAIFFLTLAPWYARNWQLTGRLFFCPMSGAYLQSFCAPKILQRINNQSYEQCWKMLSLQTMRKAKEQKQSIYFVAGDTAWPLIKAHPFYFAYDWIVQVIKTSFDLYSYQLVTFARNCFFYDPMEEFLGKKMAACLFANDVPLWMRFIAWIELIFSIFVWLGIVGALYLFGLRPLYTNIRAATPLSPHFFMLCKTAPLFFATIFMTGGFGYARLRLPIEPLMIIIALSYWLFPSGQSNQTSTKK